MLSDSEKHLNELVKSPFPQDKASKYLRDIYIILCNIYQKWINCQALAVLVQATQKKRFKNFFSIERSNEKFFSNVVSGHSTYTSVFRCLWVLTGVKNLPLFNKRKWNFTL